MRFRAGILIFMGLVLFSICAEAYKELFCNAPEIIMPEFQGYKDYNNLVCSGIEHMKEDRFDDAVFAFESALSISFLDIPNFELFPRLAMAYFRAGDIDNAKNNLLKAELSLSILIGVLKCVEVDVEDYGTSYIVRRYGHGGRLSGDAIDDVANKMCGAAYDYWYIQPSFDNTLHDAELIRRYLDVKELIVGDVTSTSAQ